MKRVVFGKRAVKKPKVEKPEIKYEVGSVVLGCIYKEKQHSVEFRLPNGSIGSCSKKYISSEMEELEKHLDTKRSKIFVKEFKRGLCVELLILSEMNKKYECTFFTQKTPKEQSLLTGFIEQKEETGYLVQVGQPSKKAFLKTEKEYSLGDLEVFQVRKEGATAYILGDEIDREIYIGEKSEICPGLVLRARVTGRPRYIVGEKRHVYTGHPYRYTADALGVCKPVVESSKEMEEEDEVVVIIVYVSEDREVVHAVLKDEYFGEIDRRVPDPGLVGREFVGEVVEIEERHSSVKVEEGDIRVRGLLFPPHYSDAATDKAVPTFAKGDRIKVRVFSVCGYDVLFTAKESLFGNEKLPPYEEGDMVTCVEKGSTEAILKCEAFGSAIIGLKRFEEEECVGKVRRVQIMSKGNMPNMYFGRRVDERWMDERRVVDRRVDEMRMVDRRVEGSAKDSAGAAEEHRRERESVKGELSDRCTGLCRRVFDASRCQSSPNGSGHRAMSDEEKSEKQKKALEKFKNGDVVSAEIYRIYQYGVFARVSKSLVVRIKIGEVSSRFVQDWQSLVHEGQRVKIVLYDINRESGTVEGSIKKYEVLNMSNRPEEEPQRVPEPQNKPLAYAVEEAEEIEEDSEEMESEGMQQEIFNSKDSSKPWIKRVQMATSARKCVEIWRKAMEMSLSPEAKKKICVVAVTSMGEGQEDAIDSETVEEVISEGVKRDGCVFLKKCIDNTRNSPNSKMHRALCAAFIREKKDAAFGYKELLYRAHREESQEILEEVKELVERNKEYMRAEDRKEIDLACINTLYVISKDEARVAMERAIGSKENKNKLEWAVKYIDHEIRNVATTADVKYLRNLLDRTVSTPGLPVSGVKGIFKTYLKFEKEFGTKDTEEKVLEMAKAYVSHLDE